MPPFSRHSLSGRLLWRHTIYFAVIGLAAVGGLLALARITPNVSISAAELAVTVYFLAAHLYSADGGRPGGQRGPVAACWALRAPPPRKKVSGPFFGKRVLTPFSSKPCGCCSLVAVGIPFVAAALATHWPKFHDTSNPQELRDFRYEAGRIRATDGVHLEGWFIPTQTTGSDTTVIVVPARGMSKTAFLPYAAMLAGDWFNVLLVDQRGEGESQGHTRGFGVLEARDVVGAVDYLRAARPRESRHVFALGVSEGASAVLAGARADPIASRPSSSTAHFRTLPPNWSR